MRYLIILLITFNLFGSTYNFDEYRFVSAISKEFHKSGTISIDDKKIVITYTKPEFKKIVADAEGIVVEDAEGEKEALEGNILFYTKIYLNLIKKIDDVEALQSNDDFDVKQEGNFYILKIKNQLSDYVKKIELTTKDDKISTFKIFMLNDDTIKILKR